MPLFWKEILLWKTIKSFMHSSSVSLVHISNHRNNILTRLSKENSWFRFGIHNFLFASISTIKFIRYARSHPRNEHHLYIHIEWKWKCFKNIIANCDLFKSRDDLFCVYPLEYIEYNMKKTLATDMERVKKKKEKLWAPRLWFMREFSSLFYVKYNSFRLSK